MSLDLIVAHMMLAPKLINLCLGSHDCCMCAGIGLTNIVLNKTSGAYVWPRVFSFNVLGDQACSHCAHPFWLIRRADKAIPTIESLLIVI